MITETQQCNGCLYTAGFGVGGSTSAYRYTLRREWQADLIDTLSGNGKHALYIMLNPSTADATRNDPTVAKCMRLARRWGFDAVEVRNIFALRSTDPRGLTHCDDPVGLENNQAIWDAVTDPRTDLIVAAWGNHGRLNKRADTVRGLLLRAARPVHCFAVSLMGEPMHPLYQPERGLRREDLLRIL